MARQPSTDKNGSSFSNELVQKVWAKGREIPKFSPDIWRWDKCGHVMKYSKYGNRQSKHGWEIDHINPVANNGSDDLDNLQPLNWKNNANKSDNLNWTCP